MSYTYLQEIRIDKVLANMKTTRAMLQNTRKKMSDSAKARCTAEWREKQSASKRAIIQDEAKFIKLHNEGFTQMMLSKEFGIGRKSVSNAIARLNLLHHKSIKRNQFGSNNSNWKGCSANLVSKHKRLYRAFGQPSTCDVCGTSENNKSYDWANLSGDYDNPSDFKRMCRSCHSKYDKKHENFKSKSKCGNS